MLRCSRPHHQQCIISTWLGQIYFYPSVYLSLPPSIAQVNVEFNIDLCQTLTWTFTAVPSTTNVSYLCGFLIFQYSFSLTNNYTCQCKNLTWACMFCEIFQRPRGPLSSSHQFTTFLEISNIPLFILRMHVQNLERS